jgi:hypothetical protein
MINPPGYAWGWYITRRWRSIRKLFLAKAIIPEYKGKAMKAKGNIPRLIGMVLSFGLILFFCFLLFLEWRYAVIEPLVPSLAYSDPDMIDMQRGPLAFLKIIPYLILALWAFVFFAIGYRLYRQPQKPKEHIVIRLSGILDLIIFCLFFVYGPDIIKALIEKSDVPDENVRDMVGTLFFVGFIFILIVLWLKKKLLLRVFANNNVRAEGQRPEKDQPRKRQSPD